MVGQRIARLPADVAALVVQAKTGPEPTQMLAGLSLLVRAAKSLERAGVERILVVGASSERHAAELAIALPALAEVRGFESLEECLAATEGPLLVTSHALVARVSVLRDLRASTADACLVQGDGRVPFHVARSSELAGAVDFDEALRRVRRGGPDVLTVGDDEVADVSAPGGRAAATRVLFEACRKPQDGFVSRHLNRHVSLALSRRIVDTRITPNQVTLFTFLMGVLAAYSVSRSTYITMLVGGLLFQLASILDGVDGELARVRMAESRLGEWLDTVSDDLTNILFYLGLAVGAVGHGPAWLSTAGYVAAAAGAGTMVFYYAELIRLGRGDFYALSWGEPAQASPTVGQRLVLFFVGVLKQDLFIFLFLATGLFGFMPYMLPVVGTGALITLGAGITRTVVGWSRRRRLSAP